MGDFVCSDVKAFINLHGIAVYDFPFEIAGTFQCCGAFSHTGGTENDEKVFIFILQF
jgi:hypothetical protein